MMMMMVMMSHGNRSLVLGSSPVCTTQVPALSISIGNTVSMAIVIFCWSWNKFIGCRDFHGHLWLSFSSHLLTILHPGFYFNGGKGV